MTPATTAQALCPLFKALADPRRLEVVLALAAGERCVCELTEQMGLAQSKLSFHLKVMREAGLLDSRVQGRWVYYRLRPEAIAQLGSWLERLQTSELPKVQSCC